jgi:capsular exopolysaccharide synthesis family protein
MQTTEPVLPDYESDYLGTVRQAFKRHRFAAFLVFAVFVITAVTVLALITPQYRATAIVMIEGQAPQVVKMDTVMPSLPTDPDTVSSEIQVLQSRDLVSEVARDLKVAENPEFNPNRAGWKRRVAIRLLSLTDALLPEDLAFRIRNAIQPPVLSDEAYRNGVLDLVDQNLHIASVGRSRAISITFTSRRPDLAAGFANALAQRYLDNQELLKQTTTEDANRRITDKLASLEQAAAQSAGQAAAFRANSSLTQGRDSVLVRQQMSETSSALTAAIADRISAEARLHEVERAARDPNKRSSAQVLGSRVIQELLILEAKLAGEITPLIQQLGEENPRLGAARAQMRDIKGRIDAEAKNIAASVRGEYDTALDREKSLRGQLDDLKAVMAKVQQDEVQLGQLEQNAQAARNVYDVFLQRSKETAAGGSVQVADARVISHASNPLRPYFPAYAIAIPVIVGFAGALSLLTTLLLEARNRGIRTQSEAGRIMAIPTLGSIPKIGGGHREIDPSSMIGSAVSDLYMRIFPRDSAKCVVVASALPQEGKTTIGLCLARMAARSGQKTLLIDCDLRRSDLSVRLELAEEAGISDVLRGKADSSDVILRDTVVPELSIITCGTGADNPAALLSSRGMADILVELRRQFDLVIVDTAPVMVAPETMSLALAADETLLFVKWSSTPRATAVAAYRKLRSLGAKVTGVVLTMVDVKRISKYSSVDAIPYSRHVSRYYSREGRP